MNQRCYRLVFNKKRGELMAVAETTLARGKAGGQTTGPAVSPAGSPTGLAINAVIGTLRFALMAAFGLVTVITPARAQIIADPSAPANQRPTILTAPNGTPLVNIQTPSAAGVSRNTYRQFDVNQQGVILNNSRTNVQTQLGGWVQGNPWLATGARVIVNEVNSANPTLLKGYIEVAGSRAQVVIANPAGITCNGCGFINANRASMTTATPVFNGGNLDSYRVQGGTIEITGNGLDASTTDYTDLIARAVQVNAGIWAKQLAVTTGVNNVDAAQGVATPLPNANAGPAPAFAIDVAQLGGMYAGKITLVGTEAGVGMRNAGSLYASAGDVVVTANGRLENAGSIASAGHLRVDATGLTNTGTLQAQGNASLNVHGTVENRNAILARDLTLTANNLINTGPQALIGSLGDTALWITNQLDNTDGATIYSAGNLAIGANPQGGSTAVVNNRSSTIEAAGDLDLTATKLENVRDNVVIDQLTTLDETRYMTAPGWYVRGDNNYAYETTASNFRAHEVYYFHPDDVLENTTLITPDGYTIGRAVVRTRANDSAFFSATTGAYGAFARAERIQATNGTRVLYYTSSSSNQANPDQGGPAEAAWNGIVSNYWSGPLPTLTPQYGNCTTNCVRFVTQPGYSDPTSTFILDTIQAAGVDLDDIEVTRQPRHIVKEQRLAAGAGQTAQLRSGRAMRLTIGQTLNNQHSYITADGNLTIGGNADIRNAGATLYRTHSFGGIWTTPQGDVLGYSRPNINEVIGSATALLASGQTTQIAAASFQNIDLAAGTMTNIVGPGPLIFAGSPPDSASLQPGPAPVFPSGLFLQNPDPAASVLFERRPQFADYRTWLSSDYLLSQLASDPATTQKRLGDGFYEQRLVREQLAELTGRVPEGFGDDSGYQTLLANAATTARQWNLRPGVALSSEQVRQLTSDIVWLVSETVKLPNGTTQEVLVPKVYLARVDDNALQAKGARIAGDSITLHARDITNRGGVLDAGNGTLKLVAGQDLLNQGGTLNGRAVTLFAGQDIKNETLTATEAVAGPQNRAAYTSLSNQATIRAKETLTLAAGRDVTDQAGNITAGDAVIVAQRDLRFGTVQTGSQYDSRTVDGVVESRNTNQQTSRIATAGNLTLQAGQDLTLAGTQASIGGNGTLAAGRHLALEAVTDEASSSVRSIPNKKGESGYASQSQTAKGATIDFKGDLTMIAGTAAQGDLTVTGSTVTGAGNLALAASGKVTVQEAREQHTAEWYDFHKSSGPLRSVRTDNAGRTASDIAIGSTLSGNTVNITSGSDALVRGSNIVATANLAIAAAGNLDIVAAQSQQEQSRLYEKRESGLMGSGGIGVSIGTRMQNNTSATTATQAVASTIGSVEGDVTLTAGNAYRQTGSDVLAPQGDIAIQAKAVTIDEARETSTSTTETKFKQSGVTVAVSSPVISAFQTAQQMAKAASNTSDSRMKALAAASTALSANNAVKAIQAGQGQTVGVKTNQIVNTDAQGNALRNADGSLSTRDATTAERAGGVDVSISLGSSKSQSQTTQTSDSARGSTVAAGSNLTITATGAGQKSDITVQGSKLSAGNQAVLLAQDQINLLAAANTSTQQSINKSKSGSVGVTMGTSGVGVTASASTGRGNADGRDVTWTNTQVNAGNAVDMTSGSDTTLKGAVVEAPQITANIGGDLAIESLQDTSTYESRQKSLGGSVTVGASTSGNVSFNKSKVDSDYASVTQQSGLRAGDGGFEVNVGNDTTLTGGAITSTQAAIDNDRNRFTTGGELTTGDIENRASYEAKSVGINVGSGINAQGKLAPSGTGAGLGSDSGSAASVTTASISGIAGNTEARTGDKESGIARIFDADKVQREIEAQVAITQTFGREASKAVASYAASQMKDLQAQQKAEAEKPAPDQEKLKALKDELQKWDEGGAYRVALHMAVGGLSGGTQGALGVGIAAAAAPLLNDLQDSLAKNLEQAGANSNVAKAAAQLVTGMTAAGIGSVASGGSAAGAMTAFNADTNNRQLHPTEEQWIKANAKRFARQEDISEDEATRRLSQQALKNVDYLWRAQLSDGNDASAEAFLSDNKQTFINDLGEQQKLFTATGQQLFRPEMFADTATPAFYQQFAQSGINRSLTTGLLKELKDSGIDIKNAAFDLAKAAKENPSLVLDAAWKAVKNIPDAVVEGFKETGGAIGEGSAVALNKELAEKLNAIYGTDVSAAQKMLLAIRITTSVTGAAGVAKTGVELTEKTAKAIGKKLDEVKTARAAEEAIADATKRARIENNVYADNTGFANVAQREFKAGTTQRAENINAGQVTDRDGLVRIDEANIQNNKQLADQLGYTPERWSTQRPAWKEGTLVTDRVTTQPETYRMVIDEGQLGKIQQSFKDGKLDEASKNLGLWATKSEVNSLSDVRNTLAIPKEWKGRNGEKLYVIEFTVKPGVGVREGTVGPMFDTINKVELPGNGHQVNFMQNNPKDRPDLYQIKPSLVIKPMELK